MYAYQADVYKRQVQDILAHASDFSPCVSDLSKNDNLILCTAIQVKLENPLAEVALVTNDVGMQVVADMIPLKTEYYRKNRLKDKDLVYTGRTKIDVYKRQKLLYSNKKRLQKEGKSSIDVLLFSHRNIYELIYHTITVVN